MLVNLEWSLLHQSQLLKSGCVDAQSSPEDDFGLLRLSEMTKRFLSQLLSASFCFGEPSCLVPRVAQFI